MWHVSRNNKLRTGSESAWTKKQEMKIFEMSFQSIDKKRVWTVFKIVRNSVLCIRTSVSNARLSYGDILNFWWSEPD